MNQPPTPASAALERFLKSMNIGYIEWHDGIGYDLEALKELTAPELDYVEGLMIGRKDADWREAEVLAAIKTPAAIAALRDCLHSHNLDVRLWAVRYLKEMGVVDRVEEVVIETLPQTKIGRGMSYALALAKDFPSEGIRRKVLWCALNGNDDIRIHCAAMALYLYGKAKTAVDMEQTIIFEFREPDRRKRQASFTALCRQIGVDPSSLL